MFGIRILQIEMFYLLFYSKKKKKSHFLIRWLSRKKLKIQAYAV